MGMIRMKAWCRRMKRLQQNDDTTSAKRQCHCKTHEKAVKLEEPKVELFEFEFDILNRMSDELLSEILIRLPIKCACRYKAVCKRWSSLISSSYFITQSINCHPKQNSFTLVFQHRVTTKPVPGCGDPDFTLKCLFPVQALSTHPMLSESYKNQYINLNILGTLTGKSTAPPIFVEASCDDLLLCRGLDGFYVINLLTDKWIVLPQALALDRVKHNKLGIISHKDDSNGGGCRFKVIRIPITTSNVGSEFSIQVFCSELGQWRHFVVDWYILQSCASTFSGKDIIAHSGRLHWVYGRSLFSLDVFNGDPLMRLSHSINIPDEVTSRLKILGACQGQLRVASILPAEGDTSDRSKTLNVWEVEDYQKGVWKLAHRVELRNSPLRRYLVDYFNPVAFHPYDRDLIFLHAKKCIILFNMRTGAFERYCCLEQKNWSEISSLIAVRLVLHPLFPTRLVSCPTPLEATAGLPIAVSPHT